ncbi:hypothetical protein SAMN06265348_109118 [Pedobacter westerhofensis]|uniref:Uncharacterized protein n=1 Tax=Pedobacter westerhofensis TaxID=425512 RepID=A0A521ET93_9SPHI|nr:hypothetical protein SAMN06265348_109118 [Pedobacter westerhofensis]
MAYAEIYADQKRFNGLPLTGYTETVFVKIMASLYYNL